MVSDVEAATANRFSETEAADENAKMNVGLGDRIASVGSGGWLVLRGLSRGGVVGFATAGLGAMLVKRGVTAHCPIYETLGVGTKSKEPPTPETFDRKSIHVARAFTINKSAADLFAFWRNFENLPRFMTHLEEVKNLDDKRSRWKAAAPAGFTVEWEAEIINEEPNRSIAWRSLGGSDVHHAGSVRFVETPDRGTEVRVVLDYIPPMGRLGWAVARVFGEEPRQQIQEDLRRFKQLMETGETATNAGPRGTCRHSTHQPGREA
jgi:uncharacterized membrane protein